MIAKEHESGVTPAIRINKKLSNMEIQNIKKGEYIKRKEGAKKTYIRGEYNRYAKAYECQNFDDISDYIYIKKGKEVFVDFEF